MQRWRRGMIAGLVLLAWALGAAAAEDSSGAADAQEQTADKRRREHVARFVNTRLDWANDALEEERYDDAIARLDELKGRTRLNPRERALIAQMYGFVYSAQERYAEAATAFGACLAADGLDRSAMMQTRYNLAQILVLLERYDDAIREFTDWFAHAPNPSGAAYYMFAMAHMQKGDKPEALRLARRAVEVGGGEVREPWLQLVAALLLEQEQVEAALPVIAQLVTRFPKKTYWLQLSAAYSQLQQPEKALAVLELAHAQGVLTEQTELLTLAQLYLYNQIPLRAADVIEQGVGAQVIAPSARAYQLLADSLLAARERERAMAPLRRAAELSDNGNAYLRIGQLHFEREEWPAARAALQAALAKGNLSSAGHAYLLLGIASANQQRWDEAEQAFASAQGYEAVQTVAAHWLRHLDSQRGLAESGGSRIAAGAAERVAGDQPPG